MFFSKASHAASGREGFFSEGGRLQYIYPGPNTTFAFTNGSSLTLENIARVIGNFSDVANGQQFYSKFCSINFDNPTESIDVTQPAARPLVASEYPTPVITTSDSTLSGYYIDGKGQEEVAILSVLSFRPESLTEFQEVAQQFMINVKRDGKTKLIIDLSDNEGGCSLLSLDLLRQFFPTIQEDEVYRWRVGKTFMALAEIFSADSDDFDPVNATENEIRWSRSWFNYHSDLNIDYQPFRSLEEKFGPYTIKGDNFTNNLRWNLNDPFVTSDAIYGAGINITGYDSRKISTQHFDASNIIMLHDGYCSSACALFSGFMRNQGGVKSIAMGGRPKEGLIRGVGGIKGGLIYSWKNIFQYAQAAAYCATEAQAEILNQLSLLPSQRSLAAYSNIRHSISSRNRDNGLPYNFDREESECRLFYTEDMVSDVKALWKAAADAAFNDKGCAYGSLPKRV
ncbi:BgTH12-05202 [Blumeria graminis f. sp. triticale]|nr:BgTH12-05202 [Blumeria graminis f. sp. triticale]